MAIYRAQISFPMDSALVRDEMVITPHYVGDNAQALADALKANLGAATQLLPSPIFKIKIYDAKQPPPSYPIATAEMGTGFKTTTVPRELAMCLSYYSTWNRPRYRGRLYIPMSFIGSAIGLRPSATQRTACMEWKTYLTNALPANTNLVVYSRKLGTANGVSNFWVDDEWDIVRSRGLRPTTRDVATLQGEPESFVAS